MKRDRLERSRIETLYARNPEALTPRERFVVQGWWGLGHPPLPYRELGRDLGVGTERVRQIRLVGEHKLRNAELGIDLGVGLRYALRAYREHRGALRELLASAAAL